MNQGHIPEWLNDWGASSIMFTCEFLICAIAKPRWLDPAGVKRKIPSTPVKPDFLVRALVVTALECPDCARDPTAEIASNANPASGCGFSRYSAK